MPLKLFFLPKRMLSWAEELRQTDRELENFLEKKMKISN